MCAALEGFISGEANPYISELAVMTGSGTQAIYGAAYDGSGAIPIGNVDCGNGNYISGLQYGRTGSIVDSICVTCSSNGNSQTYL